MPATTFPVQQLFFLDTEADVLAIRSTALCFSKEGKTIMEVQSRGGQMSQKAFALPVAQVLVECNAALKHINPALYGRTIRKTFAWMALPSVFNC